MKELLQQFFRMQLDEGKLTNEHAKAKPCGPPMQIVIYNKKLR